MGNSLFRPVQWADTNNPLPQTIMVTFPGQGNAPQYSSASGVNATLPSDQTNYVFDCVILAGHEQLLRKTQHPVQTGASISDHAYLEPARLVLDIGMSDAMDAFNQNWTGDLSKSVSCFQTMLALQFSRIPLTITTRLRTYYNMVVENLAPQETNKTFGGLRMRAEFGQIFMATTAQITVSSRDQDTNETESGNVTPQPPTDAQQQQNSLTGTTGLPVYPSNAIGAGNWSSVNVNSLTALVPKNSAIGGVNP